MRHKKINPVKSNIVGAKLFNRVKLSAVLLLGLGLTGLQAQESHNATGGNASGSGGSAIYSVGQQRWHTQQAAESTQAELKTYVPRAGIYQATRNGQN